MRQCYLFGYMNNCWDQALCRLRCLRLRVVLIRTHGAAANQSRCTTSCGLVAVHRKHMAPFSPGIPPSLVRVCSLHWFYRLLPSRSSILSDEPRVIREGRVSCSSLTEQTYPTMTEWWLAIRYQLPICICVALCYEVIKCWFWNRYWLDSLHCRYGGFNTHQMDIDHFQ